MRENNFGCGSYNYMHDGLEAAVTACSFFLYFMWAPQYNFASNRFGLCDEVALSLHDEPTHHCGCPKDKEVEPKVIFLRTALGAL